MRIPDLFAIPIARERGVSVISGVEEKAIIQDANETALKEFEAGLSRAISQYKSGQVETFEDKDEFLRTLVEQSFTSMKYKFHRTPESGI